MDLWLHHNAHGLNSFNVQQTLSCCHIDCPDSKVHGANMGPMWGRQDPGGPHIGPKNLAIWGVVPKHWLKMMILYYIFGESIYMWGTIVILYIFTEGEDTIFRPYSIYSQSIVVSPKRRIHGTFVLISGNCLPMETFQTIWCHATDDKLIHSHPDLIIMQPKKHMLTLVFDIFYITRCCVRFISQGIMLLHRSLLNEHRKYQPFANHTRNDY